ncbi:MAG: Bifunctional hemolysin/adenylate cyclase [Pseudomonadales bacterium]|nr:Bifunctional hemolysin/adenylate cyclase [Pseudomonadales bacterium]
MATLRFGQYAADMRLEDSYYGIPALQSFDEFLANFLPVREQILAQRSDYASVREYDALGRYITVSMWGNLSAAWLNRLEILGESCALQLYGSFYVDLGTENITGTATGLRGEKVLGSTRELLVEFTGLSDYIDFAGIGDIDPFADMVILAGADTITGSPGADYLLGYAGNDSISGGSGDDSLDGANGVDTLAGGAGNDSYYVDATADLPLESAGAGEDTVLAYATFTLPEHLEHLILTGDSPLAATGNGGNNRIVGNAAANRLDGGAGADTLEGGGGDDVFVIDNAADAVVEQEWTGRDTVESAITYTLGEYLEDLVLTGDEGLWGVGNSLGNWIRGNAGGNLLSGGGGTDTLSGGAGNDAYVIGIDDAFDQIVELPGEGSDLILASRSFTLPEAVEKLKLEGDAALSGHGNALANVLTGNIAANSLYGGFGADTLYGKGGDDVLDGEADADHLAGGAGEDTLNGGEGNDTLAGGMGADRLSGGTGRDTYQVTAADSVVEAAGEGIDTIVSPVSWVLAANFENLVLAGSGRTDGTGNAAANTLSGNTAGNVLGGLKGNDTLRGFGGNDTLQGGDGYDVLDGGAGDDVLIGGPGRDTLTGGAGVDAFVFGSPLVVAANVDTIGDFVAGTDTLRLDDDVFGEWTAGDQVNADQFVAGAGLSAATDSAQRLVYDTESGALYYDADGAGGAAAILFARFGIDVHPALQATDFVIVA